MSQKEAEPLVTLRALGTYPMPGPVRRGKVFQRPASEAALYVEQKKAVVVEDAAPLEPPATEPRTDRSRRKPQQEAEAE